MGMNRPLVALLLALFLLACEAERASSSRGHGYGDPQSTCTLSGIVKEESGEPWPGVQVQVYAVPSDEPLDIHSPNARMLASTQTDERGEYVFRDLLASGTTSWIAVYAEAPQDGYSILRFLHLYPMERVTLHLYLTLPCYGVVTVVGDPPHIDSTKSGSGALVVADPKTGVPLARPY